MTEYGVYCLEPSGFCYQKFSSFSMTPFFYPKLHIFWYEDFNVKMTEEKGEHMLRSCNEEKVRKQNCP